MDVTEDVVKTENEKTDVDAGSSLATGIIFPLSRLSREKLSCCKVE